MPLRYPWLLLAALFVLVGCAYTNKRAGANFRAGNKGAATVDATLQRIFIPVIDNRSSKPGMEIAFTSALRNQLANVKGVEVTNDEASADHFLLVSILGYERSKGGGVRTGDMATEAAGGLAEGQNVATDIRIRLYLEVKYLERIGPSAQSPETLRRTLWSENFNHEATFEASNLVVESEGSSSAPNINEARESLQVQNLADNLARQVVDQVLQNF